MHISSMQRPELSTSFSKKKSKEKKHLAPSFTFSIGSR
jgi:hypothetical protein